MDTTNKPDESYSLDESVAVETPPGARKPILYRTQHFTNLPLGPRTMVLFYPDGEWDGWRHRAEIAHKAYPHTEYRWVNLDALEADLVEGLSDEEHTTQSIFEDAA